MLRTIYLCFFPQNFCAPVKEAKYGHVWAEWVFFCRPAAWFNRLLQTKPNDSSLNIRRRNRYIHRKPGRTPVRSRTNITDRTYGTGGGQQSVVEQQSLVDALLRHDCKNKAITINKKGKNIFHRFLKPSGSNGNSVYDILVLATVPIY